MTKMDTNRLWAKRWTEDAPAPASAFLLGHLQDVFNAAERVLDCTGDDQLDALGLAPSDFRHRLRRCVLLGAATHDIGKANDHFQGMITVTRNTMENPQGIRHEWGTILMLKLFKAWLMPAVGNDETDFAIVEWAVAGHHPAHNHESPPKFSPPGAGAEIQLKTGHEEFVAILEWLRETFKLGPAPGCCTALRALVGQNNVFAELATWSKSASRAWDARIRKSDDAKLVAAVKDCLVAADIAGSALPKAMPDASRRWIWITESFAKKPEPGDLQCVVDVRLDRKLPRQFQVDVANSKTSVTFVKAGCGSGKTVAAYMWAARNHPTRRLYFCYPTTGTATEGFKDYLFVPEGEIDKLGAKLFHSRRDIDFEIILNNGADSRAAEADAAARLDSLEAWFTPVVACTVDTVLGIVQNNKRGLFAWPALAQSAFVFDEIHAFDDRLFGALLRFLRDLPGAPALLMTASLPKAREDALRELLKSHRGITLSPITGPVEFEKRPRYHKAAINDNNPLPLIRHTLNEGGKVLWVCNTVRRVMDAAARADGLGLAPLTYHSRYKYVDRVQRHKGVVNAFTPEHAGAALAICSQVAEMSLDLKGCTLLVSDRAPVPALIQRLGRLNRQAEDGDPTRPFVIIEPESNLPYTPPELDAARTWFASLPENNIRQRDLAEKWEQADNQPPDLVPSAWLDGGPVTAVTELREASPGITVVMREDLRRITKPKDLGKFTLPMPPPPRSFIWRSWPKHNGIPIADPGTITYDQNRGAEWVK
jgi:CRISPR-associated endonuclease/helicase Cas3